MDFQNFILESKNDIDATRYSCYATMIENHATSGVTTSLYITRAHLLQSLFPVENNTMDCNVNIGTMFQRLMNRYDSLKKKLIVAYVIITLKFRYSQSQYPV